MRGRSRSICRFSRRVARCFSQSLPASSADFDRDSPERIELEQAATRVQRVGDDVRRNADGSLDFDSYRSLADALRRHTMRDRTRLRAVGAGILATMVALAVVIMIEAAPAQPPQDPTATGQTHTAPVP
jgi:hypothetical protein